MSLLGGIFGLLGKKKDQENTVQNMMLQNQMTRGQMKTARKWQLQDRRFSQRDQRNYLTNTRKFAKKAGFNPLTVLGMLPGVGGGNATSVPGGPSPVLGSGTMEAAMMLGQGIEQSIDLAGEAQALRAENAKLNDFVKSQTLRPKVAGIYAQREAYPSRAAAMGVPENEVDIGLSVDSPDDMARRAGERFLRLGPAGTLPFDEGYSDAEKAESRYGDIIQEFVGINTLVGDVSAAAKEAYMRKYGRPFQEALKHDWAKFTDFYEASKAARLKRGLTSVQRNLVDSRFSFRDRVYGP